MRRILSHNYEVRVSTVRREDITLMPVLPEDAGGDRASGKTNVSVMDWADHRKFRIFQNNGRMYLRVDQAQ
jgi:hypothetical protein